MTSKDYHKIITAIYQQYNPDKVSEVSNLLDKYKGQEKELLESIFQKYSVSINDRLRFLALNKTKTHNSLNTVEHSDYPPSEVNSKPNNKLIWSILVGVIFVLGIIAVWWYQHDNEPENRNVPVNALSGKITEVETEVSAITKPTKATNQMPTALFSVESGIEDERQIVAVPFVIYSNGKYENPPVCEIESNERVALQECAKAKQILLPLVAANQKLYQLKNGVQVGSVTIKNTILYGFSDWQTYSALIDTKSKTSLLTNNPKIGLFLLSESIKTKPILSKRKDEMGNEMEDTFIDKIDIDGDGIAEWIYFSEDYEGSYYQIFSYKKGFWKQVFEGGYQGV